MFRLRRFPGGSGKARTLSPLAGAFSAGRFRSAVIACRRPDEDFVSGSGAHLEAEMTSGSAGVPGCRLPGEA
jgi:hypothetical protein